MRQSSDQGADIYQDFSQAAGRSADPRIADVGDSEAVGFDFRILGPLEVTAGRDRIAIGGYRQRAVLAMLLLTPDRVTSVDRLVEAVWAGHQPTTSRTQIAICVSNLRKAFKAAGFPGEVIETAPPGYMLLAGEHRIDAVRFSRRVESAQRLAQQGRAAEAAELLGDALGMWRGPALAGISSYTVETEAALLEEQRCGAYEQYAALQLELGRHREIVPELSALVQEWPLREHARAALMLAQYRSGRRSEALELFRHAREVFIGELGLEPGRVLQDLHSAILREDPALVPAAALTASPLTVSPRAGSSMTTLPPDLSTFVGREHELATLNGLLDRSPQDRSPAVGLLVGRPGVGKTTLAAYWARLVAGAFPDGRLFARLREDGSGDGDPVPTVVTRFLRTLGFAEEEIPDDLAERVALFHRSVENRRMLIVLDDVQDGWVRALIPPNGACSVLMTSREVLSIPTLVRLRLTPLHATDAVTLLDRLVGDGRVRENPGAAMRVAELCDHLPLALAAAAARLAAKPHWSLSHLESRLRDPLNRLEELSRGKPEIRAAFDLSYRDLSPAAAAMYRRLGLLNGPDSDGPEMNGPETDGPDLDVRVGAELLDTDPTDAENLMEQLVDAALLEVAGEEPNGRFRYRLPRLLALHARECARFSKTG
ncbi:BTAD domain-containing putative transcriptional regulator [Streptosporangium subroseum]|uniref:AfsR/SARP family transcriptional regulator n=1 Tax=Streptosporangium subroseum TaxID=106412 RepID=UPI0034171796